MPPSIRNQGWLPPLRVGRREHSTARGPCSLWDRGDPGRGVRALPEHGGS